jgi:hypothetical protein
MRLDDVAGNVRQALVCGAVGVAADRGGGVYRPPANNMRLHSQLVGPRH